MKKTLIIGMVLFGLVLSITGLVQECGAQQVKDLSPEQIELQKSLSAQKNTLADLQKEFNEKQLAINLMVEGFKATNPTIKSLTADQGQMKIEAEKVSRWIDDILLQIKTLNAPVAEKVE